MAAGSLFTEDFLAEGIRLASPWTTLTDPALAGFEAQLRAIFANVPNPASLNEAETEERIVRPIFRALGWDGAFAVQAPIDRRGGKHIADYSLFPSPQAFADADALSDADARLKQAVAVADAKAWSINLDQRGGGAGTGETPSAQILRYLTRAEAVSDRAVRWAVLTNGRHWRLYFAGARSLLEGYHEVDLGWLLGIAGCQAELGTPAPSPEALKQFLLLFRRDAFTPDPALGGGHFLDFAVDQGRLWETKVRKDLSTVVFDMVFPGLVRALCATVGTTPDPAALGEVREAALTLLYRLLFALYAEDRDLLPATDPRYDDYSLSKIRNDIARRLDQNDMFSTRRSDLWTTCAQLFRTIDEGDPDLGIPPYNGGLFSAQRAPLLERAPLADAVFAPLLDKLSRTEKDGRLVRINFRDLSVRELGAIYEGLLEYEPVADPSGVAGIAIRLNPFSRKDSGSYYTPDELVSLIVGRTVQPLIDERFSAFRDRAARLAGDARNDATKLAELQQMDPASLILDLKICDPAMGSGHFLVNLIDVLSGHVYTAIGAAAEAVAWGNYVSPLVERLAVIRARIQAEAETNRWTVRADQLTDRNLIKRMVLKRCVYGVDKNPMAVELAKLALWLHTFTAGAPLSFLDHHLRCGDSLFGERLRPVLDELSKRGTLLIADAVKEVERAARSMETIERLSDAEIAEVQASKAAFDEMEATLAPLRHFLDFWQALRWLVLDAAEQRALSVLLDGQFGEPLAILSGAVRPQAASEADLAALGALIARAQALIADQHFLHWPIAFPGVWRNLSSAAPDGGFDAVIGNPPWDRMKMQEVEWFAARAPVIARQARAADRKARIAALRQAGDLLAIAYDHAAARAEKALERARKCGEYPLLSKGDINIYSLFVERAQALLAPSGIAGLLTPSGIASDLTASAFFKLVASEGRIHCLYDFENRRGLGSQGERRPDFFPDVDSRFKFSCFVVGGRLRRVDATDCGFFLSDPPGMTSPDRLFRLTAADFQLVNPNTGTAPIFRTRRDTDLTTSIYRRLPVLVDRSSGVEVKAWPVKYVRMFDMTNDSHLFWTREMLEAEGAYPIAGGRWKKADTEWVPLYEGKMVQAYDHRAANIVLNVANVHRPAQPEQVSVEDHCDPHFTPQFQYFVKNSELPDLACNWFFGFKEITAATNERSMIASLLPNYSFGNKTPILLHKDRNSIEIVFFVANMNSIIFDYAARQKIHGQTLNWYMVEQLPVIAVSAYTRPFGPKTALDIVKDHVLRLTYTAWDMQSFARDMGYDGDPFRWDEVERRQLRARLDALYFHLYGITDADDIRYILSTFPIVERKDRAAFDGVYLTEELILWYHRALAAGDPDTIAPEAEVIRVARRRLRAG